MIVKIKLIDHNDDLKENFLVRLEKFLDTYNIKYRTYRVNNGNLVASVASRPVNGRYGVPLNLNVYAPVYKLLKLEMPDKKKLQNYWKNI